MEHRIGLSATKSVPETPARNRHQPIHRTVPESPLKADILLEDNVLDVDILTHKLQLYQLELEEAKLRSVQRRRLAAREAADVAAAARFRDELERQEKATDKNTLDDNYNLQLQRQRRQRRVDNPRLSVVDLNRQEGLLLRSRRASESRAGLKRAQKPGALLLSGLAVEAQAIQSATLPLRNEDSLSLHRDDVLKQRRRSTIGAGRDIVIKVSPPIDPGSLNGLGVARSSSVSSSEPSQSDLSADSSGIRTPDSSEPADFELNKELESFVFEQSSNVQAVHLNRRSLKPRRGRELSIVTDNNDRGLGAKKPGPASPLSVELYSEVQTPVEVLPSPLLRKKSLFSLFDRKDSVDDVLDLYLQDREQEQEKLQRKKGRRQSIFRRRTLVSTSAS